MTYMPITALLTRRRMEQTVASTVGPSLKAKFKARVKRRKEKPTIFSAARYTSRQTGCVRAAFRVV